MKKKTALSKEQSHMQRSEEAVTKQEAVIPHESSSDSPTQPKRHSDRSGRKKAAKRHGSSRRASRSKRRRHRTTGTDDYHAGTVELEATGQTVSGNLSATSSTKAPIPDTNSPSQQQRSQNQRISLGASSYSPVSNAGPRTISSVSDGGKLPPTALNLPTETFNPSNPMKGQSISCDVKGPRTEDCDSPSKEPPGPETDYSCRLWHPPSLEDHHETPGLPKAAYADKRHLPGSAPPSVTLDCESDQQFPKLEISLTEIMNADVPSVEASKANALNGHRQAQGSPSTSSQRRSLFAEFGSQDATLLSRSKSFLDFWRLASSEGCSVDSPRREKSRRPGPSSTSPAASTDESRLSKASRTTLFIALLIPCAVIGLIVLVVMHAHPKSPQVKHALWIDELVNVCVTVDCHSAVWELSSSVDLSEDPCKDFYSFACGHWANASSTTANEAKRHDSYMAIQRRAYVTAVNAILLKVRRRASSMVSGGVTQHIADVYRSCLKFFHEQPVNVSEAMRASGIQPPIWTAATTFEELFALAVRHTLFYNATSAINVHWVRNSTNATSQAIVEVSPGVSMAQRMGSASRRSLVARALAIIDNYATTDRMDAIESIDDALATSTSNICSRTDVTEMSLEEMDTPRTNWSSIVGEYVKLTGREEPPSKARIINLPDVRAVLDVLKNSSIPELQLYLMLVPLSEFFVLEDQVQRQEPASVDDSEDSDAMKCVRALELLFGVHYCRWVWAHVQKPGTSNDVHRMWEQVLHETNSLIQFRREIRAEHNVSAPPIGNDACHPGFASSASHQSGELAALPSQYSEDFVPNVILFSQKSPVARSGCEPFLNPESLTMRWSDRETFFRLLVPDFYHAEATEVAVNYATLGFFLSEFAIRAELPSKWNWTVHGSCLARYVRSRLGLMPPLERWRPLVQRRWAAQAALQAAAMRDARINEGGVMTRLFFLRLQHTCCSLADRDGASDSGVLQTTCNVVTMTVPQFAGAFGCQNLARLDC